jgi:replicative DNA helicase
MGIMGLQDAIVSTLKGGPVPRAEAPPEVDELTLTSIAEDAVLAGCCRNAEYATDAMSRLTAADFDLEWRQTVWQEMVRLNERGESIGSAVLYPYLGPALWDRLAGATASARNPHRRDWVAMVKHTAEIRRQAADMLAQIARDEALT